MVEVEGVEREDVGDFLVPGGTHLVQHLGAARGVGRSSLGQDFAQEWARRGHDRVRQWLADLDVVEHAHGIRAVRKCDVVTAREALEAGDFVASVKVVGLRRALCGHPRSGQTARADLERWDGPPARVGERLRLHPRVHALQFVRAERGPRTLLAQGASPSSDKRRMWYTSASRSQSKARIKSGGGVSSSHSSSGRFLPKYTFGRRTAMPPLFQCPQSITTPGMSSGRATSPAATGFRYS
jgi:hypothetical protein